MCITLKIKVLISTGRGKLVADYVKSETPIKNYIQSMKNYENECNEFVFVAVELR